jgi:F-type H+-transporting ATPase subunit alpha
LQQSQFDLATVPDQITVLLGLTNELFDLVPLERMPEAEKAVRVGASQIPDGIRKRMISGEKLSREDCNVIVDVAGAALVPFQEKK